MLKSVYYRFEELNKVACYGLDDSGSDALQPVLRALPGTTRPRSRILKLSVVPICLKGMVLSYMFLFHYSQNEERLRPGW
jgi:hypothetical protein